MQPYVIAKVFVINPDGKLLTVRRSETDERRPLQWDFPGGFVEPGEDLMEAAIRETEEEAGISLKDAQLIYAMSEAEPEKERSGTWLVFVAHVADTPEVTLSYEHDEYRWVEPIELFQEITYDRQHKMLGYALENHLLQK
jgi:8-oxo-dGTP diphosphatase